MNCKCIEEVNARIRESSGDPEAGLTTLNKVVDNAIIETIAITLKIRDKNKDGTFQKALERIGVVSYCPFCGVKCK